MRLVANLARDYRLDFDHGPLQLQGVYAAPETRVRFTVTAFPVTAHSSALRHAGIKKSDYGWGPLLRKGVIDFVGVAQLRNVDEQP